MKKKTVIVRTTEGLRDHLFEELERLRDGKSTPQNAKAVVSLAQQNYQLARLELDAARFSTIQRRSNGNDVLTLASIELVSES